MNDSDDRRGQTWVEVDLEGYGRNVSALRRLLPPGCRFMAVVKADGYGHGAVEVARRALDIGADWLGVARIEEAIELRESGVGAPILIFGHTPESAVETLVDLDLVPAVFAVDTAQALARAALRRGKTLPIHLKVDTGMGRLGLPFVEPGGDDGAAIEPVVDTIASVARLDGLVIEGLFTHFANADRRDTAATALQLERFLELSARVDRHGIDIPLKHAANSAALLTMPASHLDMVRAGIATYGLLPSSEVESENVTLRPALEWKSRVIQLKQVPAGFAVSYGSTYTTSRPTTLATVAVGYADGLSRLLSSRGEMLVGGRRVPIVGRVCMDLTVLDLGPDPDCALGDEVVIIGRQGDDELTVDAMADQLDTINYEILTSIASRVPRIYRG